MRRGGLRRRSDGTASALLLALYSGIVVIGLAFPTSLVPSTVQSGLLPHPPGASIGIPHRTPADDGAVSIGLPSAIPLSTPPSTNDSVPHWKSLAPIPSPPARIDPAFASDPSTGVAVLFGGYRNATPCGLFSTCPLGDTWILVGSTWTNVTPATITSTNSPSARWGASFAFDPRISEFVLFGGVSAVPNGANQPTHNDTWLFSPSIDRWARICTSCPGGNHTPSGRWDSGTAYDPSNNDVLLFGGANATTGVGGPIVELNDSWWFNGSAWNPLVSSRAPPSARDSPSLAWDGALREPLLFGGIPATADTWALTGAGWTSLAPPDAPSARGGALTATDPINGSVVLFGGCATNPCSSGSINETWSFLGSDWVQLFPDPSQAPDARDHAGLVPRSLAGPLVLFGGDPGGTPSNDSWLLFHLESSAVRATLRAFDVTQTTAFNATVVGGLAPIELSWIGLPHGCGSGNVSALPCTPTSPNSAPTDVRFVATDALGERVEAPGISVVVNPLPTVSALARPISGVAPLQVTLLATGSGGTGTLAYNWTFGDSTIGVGPNPSHTYLASGNFTVTVRVTDATGGAGSNDLVVPVYAVLAVHLTLTPSALVAGNLSTINATVVGGLPPYALNFSVPAGCVSMTPFEYACHVDGAGAHLVSVRASDRLGQTASANATLTVRPPPTPAPTAPVPWWQDLYLDGALAGVAIVLALIALVWRRRQRSRPKPMTTVPVPEPHEVPAPGGSLYYPPPGPPARRRRGQ